MRVIATLLALSLSGHAAAASEIAIEWRLEQPFRLFRSEIDYRLHREAALKHFKPSEIETNINDEQALSSWYEKHAYEYRQQYKAAGREPVPLDARAGWASSLYPDGTCWNFHKQRYQGCPELGHASRIPPQLRPSQNPYVLPVGHLAYVSVKGSVAGNCIWDAGAPLIRQRDSRGRIRWAQTTTALCADAIALFTPWDRGQNQGIANVKVRHESDGSSGKVSVRIKDVLIIGLGDSFASGEGNPDVPVRLSGYGGPGGAYIPLKGEDADWYDYAQMPKREKAENPAAWLDRKCHRSLYSAQVRTALQVAISDPDQHTAVTFLGYACSGAKITAGLLFPYDGIEPVRQLDHGVPDAEVPQIDKAVRELCATVPRPQRFTLGGDRLRRPSDGAMLAAIDLLQCAQLLRRPDLILLSAGGNDIGFAPLIADMTIVSDANYAGISARKLLSKGCSDPNLYDTQCKLHDAVGHVAQQRLSELLGRYRALNRAILERLNPLLGAESVIATAYPHAYHDESNRLCATSNAGMTLGHWYRNDGPKTKNACRFLSKVHTIVEAAAAEAGWTLVSAHRTAFIGHGYCAQKKDNSPLEQMNLPFRCDIDPTEIGCAEWFDAHPNAGGWQLYDLRGRHRSYAYGNRQRWLRTLNDAYLVVNFSMKPPPVSGAGDTGSDTNLQPLPANDFLTAYSSLGGAFHPTAQGLSHVADAMIAATNATLQLHRSGWESYPFKMSPEMKKIDENACAQ